MVRVRTPRSPSPLTRPRQSATAPARKGSSTAPACSRHAAAPPRSSAAEELAAPPVTSRSVARMPRAGHAGATRAAAPGHTRAAATPARSGSSTIDAVEHSTAAASTATAPPSSSLTRPGVTHTPSSVVLTVSTTESARSPPARLANRLDACPPETQPISTRPLLSSRSAPSRPPSPSAQAGATAKQHTALSRSALGERNASARSRGVSCRPLLSMSIARPRENAAVVPRLAHAAGQSTPTAAAPSVHAGRPSVRTVFTPRAAAVSGCSSRMSGIASLERDGARTGFGR
eukprot:scaffold128745_cov75-Phaeocystis_antarctica.AAC.2